MKFRLLIKQAVRDFKSKLQLYISFAIFLIVCLSIIVGLLGFFNSYSSIYNNVFNNGYTANTHLPSFKFLDHNAMSSDNLQYWKNKYPKAHYLYDKGNTFQKFVLKILSYGDDSKDYNGYQWGQKLNSDQIELLNKDINEDHQTNSDRLNLVNTIGTNDGYASLGAINAAYNSATDKTNLVKPEKLYQYFNENDQHQVGSDLYNEIVGSKYATDVSRLEYYSLIKLNRITNEPLKDLSQHPSDNFYDGCVTDKFAIETRLFNNPQYIAGYGVGMDWWPGMKYKKTDDSLRISMMPQENWMDEAAGSVTPNQFKSNQISNVWVQRRLSASEIDPQVIKDRSYAYITPSFAEEHDIHLGEKINASMLLQNEDGSPYTGDDKPKDITVIGEALSRDSYYTNKSIGVMFLPIQYLNALSRLGAINSSDSLVSPYYSPSHIFGSFSIYDKKAGDDYQAAVDDITGDLLDNFAGADPHEDIYGASYNYLLPIGWSELKVTEANILLFRILCYVISAAVAILDIIVFWFISTESIKLQKKTLWFLKAMGEYKWRISLLPVLGIMVPFLVSAILSIFGSLFVSNIMTSAVGNSYGFYLPVWSFGLYSFIVLVILAAVSFFIFLFLTYIQLSGSTLSIHSDQKIGWIIRLYMKTKPMYKKLSTGTQIGISFIVQNIMKNILTLVLLLISFAVVLFSMQFGSAARASAHSYEKRNAPYKSLMLNKQNNIDAIELNQSYIDKDLKMPESLQWTLPAMSSQIAPLFGEGYATADVSKSTIDEEETAHDVFNDTANPAVVITAKINNDDELRKVMDKGVADVYATLNDKDLNALKYMKPEDAFFNKYFSQEYMENTILNEKVPVKTIADDLFSDANNTWIDSFIKSFFGPEGNPIGGDDIRILNNLHNHKIINDYVYQILYSWLAGINMSEDRNSIKTEIHNTLQYAATNFETTIVGMRSTYNAAKSALNLDSIPLNVYFNKVLIPKDLDSAYITDLMYNGELVSGFGLDSRDMGTYNKIINPLSSIDTIGVKDLDSDNNLVKYWYTNSGKENVNINVHHIDAYVSGKFADNYRLSEGDVIDLKGIRLPIVGIDSVNSANSYPDIYIKIKGILSESSIYNEIYFNKIDLFNYLHEYIAKDWMTDIKNQKHDNEPIKNSNKVLRMKKDAADDYPIGIKVELTDLENIIDKINSNDPDAEYTLNNSVFSKTDIPYGFSHWTMSAKTGVGYTLLDYINMPIFNYSSSAYPLNYSNNLYVFSLITQHLMKSIQPIISTLDKFIAILLILAFVVALILINLVLWENKQTILLFKAMGYKKREIDGYLLSGYVIADCIGLAVGIIIAYFGIRDASEYAVSMLHVSLFFVWSWQFLVTAIAMAIIFIIMIFVAVNWYTDRQRPRDAFNTL